MNKKICVVSGTRAEWYLLKNLCKEIKNDKDLILQLIVSASHLSHDFGLTYKDIEKEFKIDKKINILLSSNDSIGICKSMGLLQISLCEAFEELKPDIVVILGDRYEMLVVASTCLMMQIPLVHLCGGELTLGAIDDSIRHAITKMSHLHFVSTELYAKRIIQLGENSKRVFNVGSIGGEIIQNMQFLSKEELQNQLNLKFNENIYLITYHPQTLNLKSTQKEIEILLNFLDQLDNATLIFTKANADESSLMINEILKKYCDENKNKASLFDNLGSLKYLSLMKIAKAVIGNSSSGICESPFFKTPCINIGDRQKGRIFAKNVISVGINDLDKAWKIFNSKSYKDELKTMINPFASENSSYKIKTILKEQNLKSLLFKEFVDL